MKKRILFLIGISIGIIICFFVLQKEEPPIKKDPHVVYDENGFSIMKNELTIVFKEEIPVTTKEKLEKTYGLQEIDPREGIIIHTYKVQGNTLSFNALTKLADHIAEIEKEAVDYANVNVKEEVVFN